MLDFAAKRHARGLSNGDKQISPFEAACFDQMLNVSAYEIFKGGKDADATDTAKQRERRRGGDVKLNLIRICRRILPLFRPQASACRKRTAARHAEASR